MRLKPHEKWDGYKVWLSDRELEQLIEELANANQNSSKKRMAGEIGGYCGLRRDEAAQVRPVDVAGTPADPVLRVWEDQAKRDKYRETPMPRDLSHRIRAAETWGGMAPDDSVFGVTGKTLNRWVQRAAERLYGQTGDEGWLELSYHDLRRTWGTRLLECGVLPTVVMSFGGWNSWDQFRDAYLGEFSPEALKRERGKVPWLNDGEIKTDATTPQNHLVPVGSRHRSQS